MFDPQTNTIKLDATTGTNPHTILHETTHAATSATLSNSNHPMTKQLTKLFNDVKDSLGTYYGSQNVDEFASEAFGNPDFQRELSRIYPDGSPISALQRFKNVVGNFVRRLLGMQNKPTGSALNEADQFIEAMLAPAPDSRDAGEMYLTSPKAVFDMVKNTYNNVSSPSSPTDKASFLQKADTFIKSSAPNKAKQFLLYSLPLQPVRDLAAKYKLEFVAQKLQKAIETMNGDMVRADSAVNATFTVAQSWLKNNRNLEKTFNSIVYTSTIEGVDPSKAASNYTGEKLDTWKGMQPNWRMLKAKGGDKVYAEMRNAYRKLYEELKDVIDGRIDFLISDPAEAAKAKKTVYQRMFEGGGIDPYFPLTRKGDFWISYDARVGDTTESVNEAFETLDQRKMRIAELEKDSRVVKGEDGKARIEPSTNLSSFKARNVPSSGFMRDVFEVVEANRPAGMTTEEFNTQKDQLMQLFVQSLPETSFAKSMRKRGGKDGKGVLGFDQDAFGAFNDRAFDLARQIQRIKYGAILQNIESEIETAWAGLKGTDKDESALIKNELIQRSQFARNPPRDMQNRLAAQANRIAFLGTIGFNLSSAVVNLSQIPLIFAPMMNGKYRADLGAGAVPKAMRDSLSLLGSTYTSKSGWTRKVSRVDKKEANVSVTGAPSIDNYFEVDNNGEFIVRKDMGLDADKVKKLERLKPVIKEYIARGFTGRSITFETLDLDSSGKKRSLWETTNAYSATAFQIAEQTNRQVAVMMAFDLELQRMEKAGIDTSTDTATNQAVEEALFMMGELNGGATLNTTSRIAQQGVGRVAMMYKGYGVSMYYLLFKTGDRAIDNLRKNNKYSAEESRAAKEQFFGTLLSSALLAGVQGMPIIGSVLMAANLFLGEDEDDAETILRKQIGELAYKGPLNAITGTDIASRIGLSNLIYRDNPYSANASDADKLMEIIGGPAWSIFSQFKRGLTDVMSSDGNVERGVESMLPAAFRNVYKGVVRYPRDEGILTRRGDPIVSDISTGGLLAQVVGFPPSEYTLAQEKARAGKRIDRSTGKKRTLLMRKLYISSRMGYDTSDEMRDIIAFNSRHPQLAITFDALRRSMKQHMRTSATMMNGVTISKSMRPTVQAHMDEYWGQ